MKFIEGFSVLCLVINFFSEVKAANILYLAGIASPSHSLWHYSLIEAIGAKGHNVTVLAVDKPKQSMKNVHVFDMEEIYGIVFGKKKMNLQNLVGAGFLQEASVLYDLMYKVCEVSGETDGFKALLNYPDNFKWDLILNEFTVSSCLIGFLHKFKYPPLISVTTYKYTTDLAEKIGGHQFIGYIPRASLPFSVNMTLMQRVKNAVVILYESVYSNYIFYPKFDKLVAKIFNIEDLPSTYDLDKRAALTLINTHPAMDYPVPLPPNVIEIGGLQIREPKPLPKDLEEFIQNGRKGAILISFGTNVRGDLFEDEKQAILINVVKKFPEYNFLWKFEKDPSKGKVANLLVKQWIPQNDVLAHPKMKAFISHSGGLGNQETTWHGVPVVAVPFFMDQNTNAHRAVLDGVATFVSLQDFTEPKLVLAVRTILEDRSYTDRMKLRSHRFRNRPMKPIETALWWIEYVLTDPNPFHLRSPIVYIGEFKAKSYDLILYVLVVLGLAFTVITRFRMSFLSKTLPLKDKLN